MIDQDRTSGVRAEETVRPLRPLGTTGLSVTLLCVGTSTLGTRSAGSPDDAADPAVAMIVKAFEGPLNFIDTSNEYGNGGESEKRIGRAIAANGGLPGGFVLATKVDPVLGTIDFSGERVRASVAESLERLGLDRLQLVYLHDPERISFEEGMARGGPVEALVRLREEGLIAHLGVAGFPIDLLQRYIETGVFEVLISHNRYTLVDQSAEPLLDEAHRRGIAFVNAAPFGGGILAKGAELQPTYRYVPAKAETLERVRAMERLCGQHGVPLAAAALQFSTRDVRIVSTIVGMSEPERIQQTLELADRPIPDELWTKLRPLMSARR